MGNNIISPAQKAYNINFAVIEMLRFKIEPLVARRLTKEISMYLINELLRESENKNYWNDVKENLNNYGK